VEEEVMPTPATPIHQIVIPANAGTHLDLDLDEEVDGRANGKMDPSVRWDDVKAAKDP
jgi:hypothetical protein